jgi:membrane protein DedA with SNARE-associated domain
MLHQMIVLTVGATDGDAVGFFVGDYFFWQNAYHTKRNIHLCQRKSDEPK